jgi:type VI secretion system protein ImpF
MSGLKGRERLQPSLLDRLTDNAPAQKREGFDQQTLNTAQLRQAVLRDLSALLNTTNLAALEDLSATPLAAKSTLNYGIPGFAGMIESAARVVALERELADAIRTYEPRIRPETLRVRSRGSQSNGANPALVFEIDCEVWAQPAPQQLFLETSIEVETRLAVVTEVKGAR